MGFPYEFSTIFYSYRNDFDAYSIGTNARIGSENQRRLISQNLDNSISHWTEDSNQHASVAVTSDGTNKLTIRRTPSNVRSEQSRNSLLITRQPKQPAGQQQSSPSLQQQQQPQQNLMTMTAHPYSGAALAMIAFLLLIVPHQHTSRDQEGSSSSIRMGTLRLSPQSSPRVPREKPRINTTDNGDLQQQ